MADLQKVTCISVGVYEHAITKGKVYDLLAVENDNYRIKGNHDRLVWINKFYFSDGIINVPLLVSWCFDDDIDQINFIDVTFTFSNGSKRWAMVTTPEKLQSHFENAKVYPPGFNMHHLIILRSFRDEDVEVTFRTLDLQGDLEEATLPLT
jgi:hypothetical protein